MNALALEEPLYKEKEDAFTGWYEKTPIGKKRKKLIAPAEDGDGGGDKARGDTRFCLALLNIAYIKDFSRILYSSNYNFPYRV